MKLAELSGRRQGLMPLEAYLSPEWFEWELDEIFGKHWQFAGLVEDASEPGDTITAMAGRHPLVVVRGEDHRLRCFHNICRHRGTQLLRSAGKAQKVITCPYHDWTYSMNGELIDVPERACEFPDLDRSQLGLHPASVETWRGMIFVHPQPDPPPFKSWLAGIEEHLGPHRPEELVEYEEGRSQHRIAANWKIVVENYIDGYHLAHLHSETLSMYDHAKLEFGFAGQHFWFREPLAPDYLAKVEEASPLPLIDHVPRAEIAAWVPMLFPNIGLSETESSWSTFHVVPVSVGETLVEVRTKVMPASSWEYLKQGWSSWASFPWKGGGRHGDDPDDPMASGDFMAEDVFACEQQYKAMRAPRFAVGATAQRLEQSILGYQERILGALGHSP